MCRASCVGPWSAMMPRALPIPTRGQLLPGLLLLFALAGCRAVETDVDYPSDLYHPNYVKRAKAVATFAQRKDRKQLPDAFRLLLDDDANIRLVAYETIRTLSPGDEDFGYRPYLPRDVRFGIVMRWQTWWERSAAGGAGAMAGGEATSGAAEASHG